MGKPQWHAEARNMRANGAKLVEISEKYGRTVEAARLACIGVECPIDHRAAQGKNMADPEWRKAHVKPRPPRQIEHADFIRAHYRRDMTATEMGRALGLTKCTIIGRARDLGLGRKRTAARI